MTKTSYLYLVAMIGVLIALGGCDGGADDDVTGDDDDTAPAGPELRPVWWTTHMM